MRTIVLAALLFGAMTAATTWRDSIQPQPPAVTIAIDPARTYQTFGGWGATLSFLRDMNFVSQAAVDQVVDEAVNDLGLTFLRLGAGYLAEPFNDNSNPRQIDWSHFYDKQSIDREGGRGLLRFAKLVRANGETPVLLLNRELPLPSPSWLSDAEFAEQVSATVLYYKNQLGIDIAFTSIDNEPYNNDPFTAEKVKGMIKALGPMLKSYGLPTKIALNEGLNPQSTWNFIVAMGNDGGVWPYIGLLNWHLYGPTDPFRSQIRDVGKARGIPTAQTEWPTQIRQLVDDLTLGGVSYWTRYHLADRGGREGGNYFVMNPDGTSFVKNNAYWRLRQFTRYVRPGAVRMEATSSSPAIKAFAFDRDRGRVVVLINDGADRSTATINGLPSGHYAASQTTERGYAELGPRESDASGSLDVTLAPRSILTLYPYAGVNRPPIVTVWAATPRFLTLPAAEIKLTASAQDVENETLSFAWSVARQPEGAQAELLSASAAQTSATGLTQAGEYVFTVTVRDTSGASKSRDVVVRAYDGNQPPVIAAGHRLYKDGWMVLPKTTNTYGQLFISAFDLEGDPVTTQFTVVSQPPKAAAKFDGANVSGLTIPGTYTFRFTASDPTHSSSREFQQIVVARRP